MAIKKVVSSPSELPALTNDFPLLKDFYKEYPDCLGKAFVLVGFGTSSSGKWVWCDTEVFRFMLPAESKMAGELLKLFPGLHGKVARPLVVVPEKTRKGIQAYIGIDDEQTHVLYLWDADQQSLETRTKEELEAQKKRKSLTLENMDIQP